jgi:hypothetical protein
MATRYAVATGVWSATSTWDNTTALPATTDTVVANGYTVTIDQSAQCTQIQTLAIGSGATVTFTASAGAITSVTTTPPAGGTLYPVSSTFPLLVTGGGGTGGRVTATTNASGVITSYSATPAAGGTGYSTTTGAATSASGGGFTLADGVTLTAAVLAGTTTCLTYAGASPNSASVVGNVTGSVGTAGMHGAAMNGTGTLNVTGNCLGASGSGLVCFSTGTVTIVGQCTGGTSGEGALLLGAGTMTITGACTGGSGATTYGAENRVAGTLTVTGNCTGGSGATAYGLNNASTGQVSVTGNCTGGSGATAYGLNNASTGQVSVTGDCIAGTALGAVGLYNASTGPVHLEGNQIGTITSGGQIGTTGLYSRVLAMWNTAQYTASYARAHGAMPGDPTGYAATPVLDALGTTYAGSQSGQAAVANVRQGVVYGPTNNLTGLAYIPAASSVAAGVNVDQTVGTAVLTAAGIQAAMASAPVGSVAADVGITQAAADKVWSSTTRTVSAATNITSTGGTTVPQTGDAYGRLGVAGAGLTALGDTRMAHLDADVSSRSTYAGADTSGTTTLLGRLTDTRSTNLDHLDADISSRSTYAGGAVASVTAPVTVGTNTDKADYSLSSAGVQALWDALTSALTTVGSVGAKLAGWVLGSDQKAVLSTDETGAGLTALGDARLAQLDAAVSSVAVAGDAMTLTSGERTAVAQALLDLVDAIETGLTPRQALRLIVAAEAGKVSGSTARGPTTVTIRNAVADDTARIVAAVDGLGNRTAITTTLE